MEKLCKILIFFIFVNFIQSCESAYEKEELKAIQDISNDYLYKNDLLDILNPPTLSDEVKFKKPDINKMNLKVYISDELRPINQIKEDNLSMFVNNSYSKADSKIFYNIVNSNRFKELKYREFDKTKIKFMKPYYYFNYNIQKLKKDETYNSIIFSRFCFDNEFKNGVTVIEYGYGGSYYSSRTFHGALLIRKINGTWKVIDRE